MSVRDDLNQIEQALTGAFTSAPAAAAAAADAVAALARVRDQLHKEGRGKSQRTLTVTDVLPLAQHIYARSPVGCCLHIVLDDDNLADSNVEFCISQAIERGHKDCEALARLLLRMTRSQRGSLAALSAAGTERER